MKRGFVHCLALAIGLLLFVRPNPVRAFEREWHVGGGIGVTAYPHYYAVGPALGLNAAYGLSDAFDLKLELLGSYHTYAVTSAGPSDSAWPYSAAAGVSYKLDVLQWIPYGALLVGYQRIFGKLPLGEPFHRSDALAALVVGLDYAATRNFGLGASVRTDMLLSSPRTSEAFTTLLRAEFHWGF